MNESEPLASDTRASIPKIRCVCTAGVSLAVVAGRLVDGSNRSTRSASFGVHPHLSEQCDRGQSGRPGGLRGDVEIVILRGALAKTDRKGLECAKKRLWPGA
jgi:hypothetical protein